MYSSNIIICELGYGEHTQTVDSEKRDPYEWS